MRAPNLLTRLQFALRHICWPRWCSRHALAYVSDLCPHCNGERLARLDMLDERTVAHLDVGGQGGEAAVQIGMARLLAFDLAAVARHVRGGRRNGLHRAFAGGEIAGR